MNLKRKESHVPLPSMQHAQASSCKGPLGPSCSFAEVHPHRHSGHPAAETEVADSLWEGVGPVLGIVIPTSRSIPYHWAIEDMDSKDRRGTPIRVS